MVPREVLPGNRLMGMCCWMGSHNFTTGLTTMGLCFQENILNGVAHFYDLEGQKIQVGRDLKMKRCLLY